MIMMLAMLAMMQLPRDTRATLPAPLRAAQAARVGPVETRMHNVDYHAGPRAVLGIRDLRGRVMPTDSGAPPWLEDPLSFTLEVDTATLVVSAASLAFLINDWIMHYPGAPLSGLHARVKGENLELTGHLHGVPFRIESRPHARPDGTVALVPVGVRLAGIGVRGAMHALGIELDDVLKVTGRRGLSVDGDTVVLVPGDAVPPPRLAGRVVAARLRGDSLVLVYGRSTRAGAVPAMAGLPDDSVNYIAYRGGVLRFGKLMMIASDLTILDANDANPFDLNLPQFERQLAAGHTRNSLTFGLTATMPDFARLGDGRGGH